MSGKIEGTINVMTANTSLETHYFGTPPQQNTSALPSDLLINIFEFLHIKAAIDFGLASHTLYQRQETASLWKFFCVRDFFSGTSIGQLPPVPYTWKTYYQFKDFLVPNELTSPGDSSNSDYMGIMSKRAEIVRTATKLDQKIFEITFGELGNHKRTIKQYEYSVRNAEGQMRYFFVQPRLVLCQQKKRWFNVHEHYTSVGKRVVVPKDYLTNPKYRSPSPALGDTSKSVRPEDTSPLPVLPSINNISSPPLGDTSKSVRSEDTSPPPVNNCTKNKGQPANSQPCIFL